MKASAPQGPVQTFQLQPGLHNSGAEVTQMWPPVYGGPPPGRDPLYGLTDLSGGSCLPATQVQGCHQWVQEVEEQEGRREVRVAIRILQEEWALLCQQVTAVPQKESIGTFATVL